MFLIREGVTYELEFAISFEAEQIDTLLKKARQKHAINKKGSYIFM
tara:strand:- start:58 stop:195 length:138 start_codon:yes stop_codon:yes gene_type:complete